MRSHIYHNSYR